MASRLRRSRIVQVVHLEYQQEKRVSAETLKGMREGPSRGMGRFTEQARNPGASSQA